MIQVNRIELLRRISIFAELDHDDLVTISNLCQWTRVSSHHTIIEASEPSTDIFFVAKGAVSARAYSTDGREVTFAHIRSGEMFGEFSAIDGKPRSARIDPLEPSIIARMRAEVFREVLLRHPGVSLLLAKHLEGKIVTGDYNLNKVARLQNVPVINLNDVANSLKPVYLPGENFDVRIVKPGEAAGQGVGYLDDGTMIVIENGWEHIGQTVRIAVTSVLQTSAGRMIFGRYEETVAEET